MTDETWISLNTIDSNYEEEMEVHTRKYRHREFAIGRMEREWVDGPAPKAEDTISFVEPDGAPYDVPQHPLRIDEDGDICDANGWLVACPARGVWKNDAEHAEQVLARLCDRVT